MEALHAFWFGELDESGMSPPAQRRNWFAGGETFDRACRERFGTLTGEAVAGGFEDWTGYDRGRIALLLLLDQLPRNIYRGTPQAFAGDSRAAALARGWTAGEAHRALPCAHQVFLFMPLEHSEDPADQALCLALFEQLALDHPSPLVEDFLRYARAHHDVIARFGRFPHRNAILGRASSAEELAHLDTHGGF
ncbi:DUF924 domain-containing protein [Mangrovimicrobium sediminis]|uniref:DUF924 domain-containing protein n=1 Tax=Mangrovimicrobium sediminis TaxID=2562682 RepID=A0A4Z0M8Y0_9GAMM|nr:DUF924 family protein [Haliea sp. SAOS-164]TGD75755.1 DUF924 domain-containing protein [Haliea sp. SAOS-164]